jgi:hypothetical protein
MGHLLVNRRTKAFPSSPRTKGFLTEFHAVGILDSSKPFLTKPCPSGMPLLYFSPDYLEGGGSATIQRVITPPADEEPL